MVQGTRSKPATAADFHRLAALAHERGLEVIQDALGRYFVTSATNPFALHATTGYSCDCPGFISHGRCTHHALLLERLGWLPEIDPEPAETARAGRPCPWCYASGREPADHLGCYVNCSWCEGRGTIEEDVAVAA